jgi:hypothetical protein
MTNHPDDEEYLVIDAEKLKAAEPRIKILLSCLEGKPWCDHVEKQFEHVMASFHENRGKSWMWDSIPASLKEQADLCRRKECPCAEAKRQKVGDWLNEISAGLNMP